MQIVSRNPVKTYYQRIAAMDLEAVEAYLEGWDSRYITYLELAQKYPDWQHSCDLDGSWFPVR